MIVEIHFHHSDDKSPKYWKKNMFTTSMSTTNPTGSSVCEFIFCTSNFWGTAVAQWLRCCATNRKVAGSIPAGVSGFYIDIKSFLPLYDPGVDSASERNEYQEYFLGVKAAGA